MSSFCIAETGLRSWTDTYGRTFEAAFSGVSGTKAAFSMPGGRKFEFDVRDLSAADQAIIQGAAGGVIEKGSMNFGRPWPQSAGSQGNPGCKVISESREKGQFVYESPGYRFHTDERITNDALDTFAIVFESTRSYLKALPLSLLGGEAVEKKSRVLIFGERERYYRSGGPRGSGGCYVARSRLVLVPMESLGLARGGTGLGRDSTKSNATLIHELVHQLTPAAYFTPGAMGWFTEGLAEYVAATPYFNGTFRPDPHGNAVLKYVTAYGMDGREGRNLGTRLVVPGLSSFMKMSYGDFAGENGNANYGFALLLTHYFFHMEGNGDARRITSFLKGLREGIRGDAALEGLAGGGGWERLEEDIAEKWGRKGIVIRFGG